MMVITLWVIQKVWVVNGGEGLVSRARCSEGGRERLVTVVDFPCAIVECCDVQLDYSIRNNEVQSCDITCASSTCTRAIQRTRVDLLRHTFLVIICVTSRLMKFLVHTERRLQSPDVPSPPLNVWPARLGRGEDYFLGR